MSEPAEFQHRRRIQRDLSRRGFLTTTAAGATAMAADMGQINALQSAAVTQQLKQQGTRVIL
ncbi:MAG: twin-arginine translocation signal domain-containing protein, partial [Fuerstiella sp.]|nr:twin-arginine translocation signal domain-containing protein [Fuerstiella sp.]